MKLPIISVKKESKGDIALPRQFSEPVRQDLIQKAHRIQELSGRQPYGAKPGAGMRASAELSRRRHDYRGSYGFGISRVPRKILSRRGTRMNWVGAVAPGTVGGRRAHPPKAYKNTELKINAKEKRKAIRSALAATIKKDTVMKRGHRVPDAYPFVLAKDVEAIARTKDARTLFSAIGLADELARSAKTGIRAGKGTMRNRRARPRIGPLVVVSRRCGLSDACKNLPGVDVVPIKRLSVLTLAPGAHPGRLTLFTEEAIKTLQKENLFM
ncbi:50S ribosomal protein L4 [Candidatus Woesearchaeota archaeon]|nr:50S ribosomal protein L4 [Candidatus Woesearchaeota archaeon]